MSDASLIAQTTYAELVERCAAAAFRNAFPEKGSFVSKTIKGRRYWYFQEPVERGRAQRYVGPETPELMERIAHHCEAKDDERERQTIVSALVRSYGMPRPIDEIGKTVAVLANAGVFRLRAVLVGTVAYQTYCAMLGARLRSAALSTDDIDIAQFKNVSVAVRDEIPPVLELLQEVDASFSPVPHTDDSRRSTTYQARRGLRVDFLTPNEGGDTDEPQHLPALRTEAQPLRFLDFLIHEPEPAVVLHGAGIYVHVPAPERYAVHKLIVARRRRAGSAKSEKDLVQAEGLIPLLARKRPHELRAVWDEAMRRGPTWRNCIVQSVSALGPLSRDTLLKAANWTRSQIPDAELGFDRRPPRYDADRDVVQFEGSDRGDPVRCEIGGEALEDYFAADGVSQNERLASFSGNRAAIEKLAVTKYLLSPIEEPGAVLIKTAEVEKLRRMTGR